MRIYPSANIDSEPEKWIPPAPFTMPNLFGGRRRYDFDDQVGEWKTYQAEESADARGKLILKQNLYHLKLGEEDL